MTVPEAPLGELEGGRGPTADGWFVLGVRESQWFHAEGRSAVAHFEGTVDFPQLGVSVWSLGPGEAMSMYHWEADQEDFLVVSGEAVLVVEGEERPLQAWDFVHCPPGTKHTIVGAGTGRCVVVAVGAREHQDTPDWGGYTVDATAARHGASVEADTIHPAEAYAPLHKRQPTAYRDGWLPD